MKNKTAIKYLTLLLALLVLSPGVVSCTDQTDGAQQYSANSNVISYKDFSLDTDAIGLDTKVHGSIFVTGDNEKAETLRVRLIAWVEIDPADWGGVEFLVPQGWEVSEIVSDYPQGSTNPDEYVTLWQTADTNTEWHMFVDIGYSKYLTDLGGGGQGTISIELKPISPEQGLPNSIDIDIGAGSEGDTVKNPCCQRINIPLN